jgi:dienelactone hydrolase
MHMFESVVIMEGGPQLAADLYLPEGPKGSTGYPGVIAASGFGGVKEMLLPAFAEALAKAGIACLLVDFAGFGGSANAPGDPRQHVEPSAQIYDMRRALDYLARDRRIDASRLGVWGPSMCGAHVLVLAGTDPRIRAAVSIIPFVKAPLKPPSFSAGLALAAHAMRRALGLPSNMIAAAGRPGERAVMTNDGALAWIQAVTREAPLFRNEVTVASLVSVATYRPLQMIGPAGICVPLRTILATHDSITPAKHAREALRGVPLHDVVEFPGSHFELFNEHMTQVIDLTVAWFTQHLARFESKSSNGVTASIQ